MDYIDPSIYMPFGTGPRQCIGIRFALLEIKIFLIKLLKKYNLNSTKNTPKFDEISLGTFIYGPPLKLSITKRN